MAVCWRKGKEASVAEMSKQGAEVRAGLHRPFGTVFLWEEGGSHLGVLSRGIIKSDLGGFCLFVCLFV